MASTTPEPSSRSRNPQACAECKRLKLKCDKKPPCSSCTRRGCASICPQGSLVTKGSRFILANTEQLHEKIDVLTSRVRELERALETSHGRHSSVPHPILEEEPRLVAAPIDAVAPETEPQAAEKGGDLAECVGTLTHGSRGTRYFGSTGDFAFAWQDRNGPDGEIFKSKGEVSQGLAELPTELADMAQSFPIHLPTYDDTHLKTWILENALPPFEKAWSLFENFWEHHTFQFTPFTRSSFVEQILSPLYNRSSNINDKPLGHHLGLLFIVFAIGDLLDLTQPWVPSRGLRYYLLARASLCLDPVLESPTVTALQAMHLVGIFLMSSPGANEPEHAWVQAGVNIKLAFTLGLQHDASKFNLSPEEVENRRHILISVFSTDVWQSLSLGRPPSQTILSNFEWISPKLRDDAGRSEASRHWATNFVRECTCRVLETVVGNKVTSYSAIMQLHAKIENFPEPDLSADGSNSHESGGVSVGITLQRTFVGVLKEIAFLFLHRRGFALALRDYPDDPLRSPFAPSVMACHRNAIAYVFKINAAYSSIPALMLRIWYIWPNVFVATLVLGSIVARSPGCSLAPSSLHSLDKVCRLWESASECVCGGKVLDIVKQLKKKAFMAFAQNQTPMDGFGADSEGIAVLDEIHALGGYGPRVISTRTTSTYLPKSKIKTDLPQSPRSTGNPSDPASRHLPALDFHAPSNIYDNITDIQTTAPSVARSTADSFPSGPTPSDHFDWDKYDYLDNTVATDSDGRLDVQGEGSGNDLAPNIRPTFVEGLGLGLGGEWQPVMDHLGL